MVSNTNIVPIPYAKVKMQDFNTNVQFIEAGTNCVFSIVPKVPAKGILEVYENSIKFYHPDQQTPETEPPERQDNDIKTFSAKSRQRLFQKFNKINYSSYGIPLFLSLTFHFDDPNSKKSLKTFIRNYLKRLFRQLPPFDYIWKFEFQKRGTPHYHMILFPHSKTYDFDLENVKNICTKNWLELKSCNCTACQKYAVNVLKLETLKKSLSYIAKEIAKVQDHYEISDVGRYWGTSSKLRMNKKCVVDCSVDQYEKFISIAIQNIEEKIKLVSPDKKNQIDKYNKSILYLKGLKWIPFNSTIFIPDSQIEDDIIDLQAKNLVKSTPKKMILKKYSWQG